MGKKEHFAKSAGLKSVFFIGDDKILVTSFGKGNNAVPEKRIVNRNVEDLEKNLDVKLLDRDLKVARVLKNDEAYITAKPVYANDPLRKKGEDMLGRKDELEKLYFGKSFNDNIHIQLIYNIMDMEKILGIHVNNAIHALNNVLNRGREDLSDFIGTMNAIDYASFKNGAQKKYAIFCENIKKPQLSYFGAFFNTGFNTSKGNKKEKTNRKDEKDIYYMMALLSYIRQAVAHGKDQNKKEGNFPTALYTLDEKYDDLYKNQKFRQEARAVLDSLYDARVDTLNENFLNNAKKDLTIIFNVLKTTDRAEKINLIRRYYDFLVKKEYKYLGFSIKKLRETIISRNQTIQDPKFDSMRPRLNRLIDFVIYMYYYNRSAKADALVQSLRAQTTVDDKDRIYNTEASSLWNQIRDQVMGGIIPSMDGEKISALEADSTISQTSIEKMTGSWKPISSNSHYFIKLVYLLALFLDGKEINDLVTTLINKTENIAAFNEIIRELPSLTGEKLKKTKSMSLDEFLKADAKRLGYETEYEVFTDSSIMAEELRALNSFARMEKPDASAKRVMFVEAARMLGDTGSEQELTDYFNEILDHEKKPTEAQKGLRNFIRNNVIESLRFKYLVRYCNVEDVIAFSKNKELIRFVLKGIPQAQLLRYYNSCKDTKHETYCSFMLDDLTDIIENMSFKQFENVNQKSNTQFKSGKDKLRKQNIIRLYLTVAYIFFKNLIYVNARYFLAFYCLERDLRLWGETGKLGFTEGKLSYTALTRKFLEMGKVRSKGKVLKDENGRTKKDTEGHILFDKDDKHIPNVYLRTNLDNADDLAINKFRNAADHINVVQYAPKYLYDLKNPQSYYQIYHYIMQRLLADRLENEKVNEQTKKYLAAVKEHGSYCKDFVKALCVPFGYNLPRFKNLSIDGLFDKNDARKERKTEPED